MAKNKKWTAEDERILTDLIKENPSNIQEALRKASIILDRTPGACGYRWYGVLLKKQDLAICFATVGCKNSIINKKIETTGNTKKTTISWWKKFLALLNK